MAPTEGKDGEEEAPEPKIVADLKALDDKYLELEKECQKEMQELARKYTEMQQPLLDERAKRLAKAEGDDDAGTFGTPAIKGFWATALANHPDLEDQIHSWDRAVLEYLKDVTKENLDITDSNKGFKLTFLFSENPYFEHTELWKEYHTEETSPYTGDIDTSEVKSSPIIWKPGKDVTMETVKKKAKGGAKKKASEKLEERPSFFRTFFRNMHRDDDPPGDVEMIFPEEGMDDDQDDVELMAMVLQSDYEAGCAIRDYIIPYAVRWYTGEAAEQDDDDREDEESEEEEDESESDTDDSPRGKGKSRRGGAAAPNKAASKKKENRDEETAKKEDCKQQ